MKRFLIGLILLCVSVIGFIPLAVYGVLETLIHAIRGKKFFKESLNILGDFILSIATIVDVMLNVILQIPMNRILIKDGYKFGSRKDTISFVLGINQMDGKLTQVGDWVRRLLDIFEKDHCLKSAR